MTNEPCYRTFESSKINPIDSLECKDQPASDPCNERLLHARVKATDCLQQQFVWSDFALDYNFML